MHAREGTTIPPLADYCLFRQLQEGERPPAEAGAAMLALIQADLLPSFALVAYEPLERAGRDQQPPQQLQQQLQQMLPRTLQHLFLLHLHLCFRMY